jgi:hypothetical protein
MKTPELPPNLPPLPPVPEGYSRWEYRGTDWQGGTGQYIEAVREPAKDQPASGESTGVEARVCEDIAARQRLGIAKYGVTVEQSPDDMLRHAYEEALDLAVYLKAELERRAR